MKKKKKEEEKKQEKKKENERQRRERRKIRAGSKRIKGRIKYTRSSSVPIPRRKHGRNGG